MGDDAGGRGKAKAGGAAAGGAGGSGVRRERSSSSSLAKAKVSTFQGSNPNEVCYSVCGTVFRVDKIYKDLKPVGKGSYGIVCSAVNSVTGEAVAIKKVSPISTHVIDAKHVLREIRMMRYLGKHENIITLKDLFIREADDELYIVMELLESDLHRIIQSKQALSEAHHRFFMHQLLKGLKFLHDHHIIHRDLKPGNLLVTRSCELRITDFGLARARPDEPMTEHVVTRWYRPPELMLCPDGMYTYAVDMWSVGCIFAELLGRKPLFPGKNFVHQLTLIFDVIGAPKPAEVAHVRSSQARRFIESVAMKRAVPFSALYPSASGEAIHLLESLLVYDPSARLTVDQALAHPYFEPLRSMDQQRPPPLPVTDRLDFSFETGHMSKGQLKQLILKEVDSFRRETRMARADALSSAANEALAQQQQQQPTAPVPPPAAAASSSSESSASGGARGGSSAGRKLQAAGVYRGASAAAARGARPGMQGDRGGLMQRSSPRTLASSSGGEPASHRRASAPHAGHHGGGGGSTTSYSRSSSVGSGCSSSSNVSSSPLDHAMEGAETGGTCDGSSLPPTKRAGSIGGHFSSSSSFSASGAGSSGGGGGGVHRRRASSLQSSADSTSRHQPQPQRPPSSTPASSSLPSAYGGSYAAVQQQQGQAQHGGAYHQQHTAPPSDDAMMMCDDDPSVDDSPGLRPAAASAAVGRRRSWGEAAGGRRRASSMGGGGSMMMAVGGQACDDQEATGMAVDDHDDVQEDGENMPGRANNLGYAASGGGQQAAAAMMMMGGQDDVRGAEPVWPSSMMSASAAHEAGMAVDPPRSSSSYHPHHMAAKPMAGTAIMRPYGGSSRGGAVRGSSGGSARGGPYGGRAAPVGGRSYKYSSSGGTPLSSSYGGSSVAMMMMQPSVPADPAASSSSTTVLAVSSRFQPQALSRATSAFPSSSATLDHDHPLASSAASSDYGVKVRKTGLLGAASGPTPAAGAYDMQHHVHHVHHYHHHHPPPAVPQPAAAAAGAALPVAGALGCGGGAGMGGMSATQQAASSSGGSSSSAACRRRLTVPKSPHFSLMSWQRKQPGSHLHQQPYGVMPGQGTGGSKGGGGTRPMASTQQLQQQQGGSSRSSWK